jgi:hypothetical protein
LFKTTDRNEVKSTEWQTIPLIEATIGDKLFRNVFEERIETITTTRVTEWKSTQRKVIQTYFRRHFYNEVLIWPRVLRAIEAKEWSSFVLGETGGRGLEAARRNVFRTVYLLILCTGDNKCELACRPKGHRFFVQLATQVIDGTRCQPNNPYNICIGGKCQVGTPCASASTIQCTCTEQRWRASLMATR